MSECTCTTENVLPWCSAHGLDSATLEWLYLFDLCEVRYSRELQNIRGTRVSRRAWARESDAHTPRLQIPRTETPSTDGST
jgi:hypothetical protein